MFIVGRKKISCIPTMMTFENVKVPAAPKYVLNMQLDDNDSFIATYEPSDSALETYEDLSLIVIANGVFWSGNKSYTDEDTGLIVNIPKFAQSIVDAYPEILEIGGLTTLLDSGGGAYLLKFYASDSDGNPTQWDYNYFTLLGALGANLKIKDGSNGYWREPHTVKLRKTIDPDGVDIYPYLAVNDEEELDIHLCGLGFSEAM